MSRAPAAHPYDQRLADELARWTAAGLITPEQAASISALEAARPAPERDTAPAGAAPAPRRLSVASEVLAYLGGLLATVAALLIGVRLWHQLNVAGRVSLLVVVTLALAAAGFWLADSKEPAALRLRAFLWFASTGALAGTAGVVGAQVFDLGPQGVGLVVGLCVTAYAGALWRLLPTGLQVAALCAGLVATALFALSFAGDLRPSWYAVVLAVIGLLTAAAAVQDLLPPRMASLAIGAVEILAACQVFSADLGGAGSAIAVVVTLGMLAVGVLADERLLLWLGVAGTFVFLPQLVVAIAGNTIGLPIGLLAAGIVLLVVALRQVHRAGRAGSDLTGERDHGRRDELHGDR